MKETTIVKNGKEYKGILYEDFLTYKRWANKGYRVKKGSKSVYKSISFPKIKDKKTGEETSMPVTYHLFHISQVEKIK